MFFIASKILDSITNPAVWIAACFVLALLVRNEKLRKRFVRTGMVLFLVLTNPFIAHRLLLWWEVPSRNAASITQPYDAGIVLGGSMRYYNSETQRVVYGSSVDRMLQAIDLYHGKKIKKIMLNGGSGYVMYKDWKEAAWLAQELYNCCVPDSDVIIENESRNTYQNAVYAANILKSGQYGSRFLLITSATHMRRSLMCFENAGLRVEPYAVDERSGKGIYTPDRIIVPDAENLNNWDTLIHEWLGIITYKMAGYI